jgi:hypothetical protein
MWQPQCAVLGTPDRLGTTLATDHPPSRACLPSLLCLHAHAGKHHRAYVDNMNKQIAGTDLEGKSLEEIVMASWNGGNPTPVFNNAAQVGAGQGTWVQVQLLTGLLYVFEGCSFSCCRRQQVETLW